MRRMTWMVWVAALVGCTEGGVLPAPEKHYDSCAVPTDCDDGKTVCKGDEPDSGGWGLCLPGDWFEKNSDTEKHKRCVIQADVPNDDGTAHCHRQGLNDNICVGVHSVGGGICLPKSWFPEPPQPDAGNAIDAGQIDAGSDAGVDAGDAPDAGDEPDAGTEPDAGVNVGVDAGALDAGANDGGNNDAGNDADVDAGTSDAGTADAGQPDAGTPVIEVITITDITHTETETCSTFTWKTSRPSPSILHTAAFMAGIELDFTMQLYRESTLNGLRLEHLMLVCGFTPAEHRTFRILAQATNAAGQAIGEFTTLDHRDRLAPTASGLQVSCSTSSCEVLVGSSEKQSFNEVWTKAPGASAFVRASQLPVSPPEQFVQVSLSGLTAGTTYEAHVIVTDEAGNTSSPSTSFTLTTDTIVFDTTPPHDFGAFDAGALTETSAKVGWWADEPVTGEVWCASTQADLAGAGGPSVRKIVISVPSGQTGATGGTVVVSGLTTNIEYWCKLVVVDVSPHPNRAESSAFTLRAKPTPPAPPPLELKVVAGYNDNRTTKLDLNVITSRPVAAVEVRWGLDPNLTAPASVVGTGGASNFTAFPLTVPSTSTIFYQAVVAEVLGGVTTTSPIASQVMWAPETNDVITLACDSVHGPGCQVRVFSAYSAPNGDVTTGIFTIPFRRACTDVAWDRSLSSPPYEMFRATTSAGPDALRMWLLKGQPYKNSSGTYVLPRSRNVSYPDLVGFTRDLIGCPVAGYSGG